MTREIPAGGLEWIEDQSALSPEDEAIANEEIERIWLATPKVARPHLWGCGLVLIGFTAWTARPDLIVSYEPKRGPCPGCGGVHPRPGRHCVVCSADHRDPTQRAMRDSKREAESRRHDLAGGTGKSVPIPLTRRGKRAG